MRGSLLVVVVILLGAFAHEFVGVTPIRAATEASTLAPHIAQPNWIVWYAASANMIVLGAARTASRA